MRLPRRYAPRNDIVNEYGLRALKGDKINRSLRAERSNPLNEGESLVLMP